MVGACVGMSAPVNVFVSKELNRLDILSGEISVYSVKGNLVLYRTVDNHLYIGTLGLSSRVPWSETRAGYTRRAQSHNSLNCKELKAEAL